MEHKFFAVHADFDFVVGLKLPRQQLRRERVEQMFLNRAFERAGAELRVVTLPLLMFQRCLTVPQTGRSLEANTYDQPQMNGIKAC